MRGMLPCKCADAEGGTRKRARAAGAGSLFRLLALLSGGMVCAVFGAAPGPASASALRLQHEHAHGNAQWLGQGVLMGAYQDAEPDVNKLQGQVAEVEWVLRAAPVVNRTVSVAGDLAHMASAIARDCSAALREEGAQIARNASAAAQAALDSRPPAAGDTKGDATSEGLRAAKESLEANLASLEAAWKAHCERAAAPANSLQSSVPLASSGNSTNGNGTTISDNAVFHYVIASLGALVGLLLIFFPPRYGRWSNAMLVFYAYGIIGFAIAWYSFQMPAVYASDSEQWWKDELACYAIGVACGLLFLLPVFLLPLDGPASALLVGFGMGVVLGIQANTAGLFQLASSPPWFTLVCACAGGAFVVGTSFLIVASASSRSRQAVVFAHCWVGAYLFIKLIGIAVGDYPNEYDLQAPAQAKFLPPQSWNYYAYLALYDCSGSAGISLPVVCLRPWCVRPCHGRGSGRVPAPTRTLAESLGWLTGGGQRRRCRGQSRDIRKCVWSCGWREHASAQGRCARWHRPAAAWPGRPARIRRHAQPWSGHGVVHFWLTTRFGILLYKIKNLSLDRLHPSASSMGHTVPHHYNTYNTHEQHNCQQDNAGNVRECLGPSASVCERC